MVSVIVFIISFFFVLIISNLTYLASSLAVAASAAAKISAGVNDVVAFGSSTGSSTLRESYKKARLSMTAVASEALVLLLTSIELTKSTSLSTSSITVAKTSKRVLEVTNDVP